MREGKRKGFGVKRGGCKHLSPLRSFVKQHNSSKNPATGEPRWLVACELPYLVIKVTCCQTVCAGVSRRYSGGGESLHSPTGAQRVFNPRRTQQDHRREAAERKTPNMTMQGGGSRKRLHRLQVAAAKRCSTPSFVIVVLLQLRQVCWIRSKCETLQSPQAERWWLWHVIGWLIICIRRQLNSVKWPVSCAFVHVIFQDSVW